MDNINMTCGEIQTAEGFVYVILPVILNQTLNDPDCEQSWYTEDGRLLAHPSDPHKLMYPVTSVSSDRLVTSDCVNLIHEIKCHSKRIIHDTMFRVRNETAATPNSDVLNEVTPSLQLSDQLWWLFALFIFIFIIFICFMLRKRIFRCFQREERFICQREDDPENRDLVKVISAEPCSLQESETVRCPDDDQHLVL